MGCNTLVYVIHFDDTTLVTYCFVNEREIEFVVEYDPSILAF